MISYPLLARLIFGCLRHQQRSYGFTPRKAYQDLGLAAPGNDGGGARAGGPFGGQNFGQHAAPADAGAGATGHGFKGRVASLRLLNQRGQGVFARVGREQAFLVGQDDEQIGFHQVGDQGTQCVVVAELDLVVDDGVVFIDHRHHPQLNQRQQRGAGIQVAFAISQVGVG